MAAACGLDPSAFGGSATAGKLAGEQKRKPRTAAEKRKGISGKLKKKEAVCMKHHQFSVHFGLNLVCLG